MFYNKHGKKLSTENIINIMKVIDTKLDGKVLKNTSFKLDKDYFVSIYDMIVIDKNLYAFISKLGKGAFGEVHKCKNVITGKNVAIKSQQCCYNVDNQVMVTKNHGIGYNNEVRGPKKYGDYKYFVLPLADMDMEKWASQSDWKQILDSFIDICIDLERLHADGKAHLDLKPDNILMINNKAFISDFGKSEPIGKVVSIIYDDYKKYPHTPPEYFITGCNNNYYKVSSSFDSWSLGFIVKKNIKYFPYHLQSMLSHIVAELSNINYSKRMTILQAKNEFLNMIKIYKNPWWKIY